MVLRNTPDCLGKGNLRSLQNYSRKAAGPRYGRPSALFQSRVASAAKPPDTADVEKNLAAGQLGLATENPRYAPSQSVRAHR